MKYFDFETAAILRILDFDDMIILALLYDNYTGTQCGKILNISQPAVSQRTTKISSVLPFKLLQPEGRAVSLTVEGRVLASACKVAIKIMTESIIMR